MENLKIKKIYINIYNKIFSAEDLSLLSNSTLNNYYSSNNRSTKNPFFNKNIKYSPRAKDSNSLKKKELESI